MFHFFKKWNIFVLPASNSVEFLTGGRRYSHSRDKSELTFYCYILILINELTRKYLKIKQLKNSKKIIVIINRSIGIAGNGFFCHLDVRRYLIKAWPGPLISDLSQAANDSFMQLPQYQ